MGEVASLTADQLRQIERKLVHTSRNIFTVAENVAGEEITDPDNLFDAMTNQGISKCEDCNTWKFMSEMTCWNKELCEDCDDE